MPTASFRKENATAPSGYFEWEAAGLRWLAEATPSGGAEVGEVLDISDDALTLTRIQPESPTRRAGEAFGRSLAVTHAAGAAAYGSAPGGWTGDGFLGPLSELLPLRLAERPDWGTFYAEQRIIATLRMGFDRGVYDQDDSGLFEDVAARVASGEFDDDGPPARIHGDLWSGNVMWREDGVVLIDPAAHGGHRETDIGMLTLFGAPHIEVVIAAYDEAAPLSPGWRERQQLHQLHPLMVHAVLFGGPFVHQSRTAAKRYR